MGCSPDSDITQRLSGRFFQRGYHNLLRDPRALCGQQHPLGGPSCGLWRELLPAVLQIIVHYCSFSSCSVAHNFICYR